LPYLRKDAQKPKPNLESSDCSYVCVRVTVHYLETVVFLFHLLSATSKPLSSLSTRLAHAARLGFFYKNTLYKFSFVIITFVHIVQWLGVELCKLSLQASKIHFCIRKM